MKNINNYPESALVKMSVQAKSSEPTSRLPVWPHSPRWHNAKIIMRLLIVFCSVCIWGLFALDLTIALLLGPVMFVDLIWQFAEFTVLVKSRRTKKRGIHPVAHLVADLLLWMAYYSIAVTYDIAIYFMVTDGVLQQHFSAKLTISVLSHCIW